MSNAPTRKQISHERIVEAASRAIRRAGTRGVGVADMMKEAGLTHGGFYAHFESRDALVTEALRRAGCASTDALKEAVARRTTNGESRFVSLVHAYLSDRHLEHVEDGCVVAALASEMNRLDDDVRAEARHRVTTLIDLVRSALPPGEDPAQAETITATLVGALQLARAIGGQPGQALLARVREQLISPPQPLSPH